LPKNTPPQPSTRQAMAQPHQPLQVQVQQLASGSQLQRIVSAPERKEESSRGNGPPERQRQTDGSAHKGNDGWGGWSGRRSSTPDAGKVEGVGEKLASRGDLGQPEHNAGSRGDASGSRQPQGEANIIRRGREGSNAPDLSLRDSGKPANAPQGRDDKGNNTRDNRGSPREGRTGDSANPQDTRQLPNVARGPDEKLQTDKAGNEDRHRQSDNAKDQRDRTDQRERMDRRESMERSERTGSRGRRS
jgi:hypothetical protein